MFRQLDYQERVMSAVNLYLNRLRTEKKIADEAIQLINTQPHLASALTPPDFVKRTWKAMSSNGILPASRAGIPYSERHDGCGRPVPNVVLKVPTGGGKTWLAVSSVTRVLGQYLSTNSGFVLWIVPNEAIYSQTLSNLRNRQHPYRQALDRVAAGQVRIMEKSNRLNARDVESCLCVMLLMLQSANRQSKETLKMFRDRGDIHGFFPPEGEQLAHRAVFEETPNLNGYNDIYPLVKDSLGNALRVIRPVVVIDEGHKAISELAFRTLYDFNPCFVLELTATPKDVHLRRGRNPSRERYANLLVEVTGRELDREGMIKIPLNLDSRQGTDWRATLNTALCKLSDLDSAAKQLLANTNRYIRPIMLVQVERTGSDQRDSGHIHAEDVKETLLTLGFDEAEIAIKTAEQNDLRQPENQNLLLPTNRIRVIITKQALQEGWDCPFAYVLCSLAANSNLQALTQLVGRILRQPDAEKTGIHALDECHIVTHHAETASVVQAIKHGLEQDGLGDLAVSVSQDETILQNQPAQRKIQRRQEFNLTPIYLPLVMHVDGSEVRELDYETDVLSCIDWRDFDPAEIAARIPDNAQAAESQLQRIRYAEQGPERFVGETVGKNNEVLVFDPAHVVRLILDIVPNPFIGRKIVERLIVALQRRNFSEKRLGQISRLIAEELRDGLDAQRNIDAEAIFKHKVIEGSIQFRLRVDGRNWKMPSEVETTEPENSRQLLNNTGGPLMRSFFSPVYENEFNNDERDVAVYLDGESALIWWHRNVARRQYGLQGWKKARVYPDFIFATHDNCVGKRITILETKGDQLENNLDTIYKRELLSLLSGNFKWDDWTPAGELELIQRDGVVVRCALVLMSEWKAKLPSLF